MPAPGISAIPLHRVCGQGDDGHRWTRHPWLPDRRRGLITVHHGHLAVHQYDVVLLTSAMSPPRPLVRDINAHAKAGQHGLGHFLIHGVVLSQEDDALHGDTIGRDSDDEDTADEIRRGVTQSPQTTPNKSERRIGLLMQRRMPACSRSLVGPGIGGSQHHQPRIPSSVSP